MEKPCVCPFAFYHRTINAKVEGEGEKRGGESVEGKDRSGSTRTVLNFHHYQVGWRGGKRKKKGRKRKDEDNGPIIFPLKDPSLSPPF